MIKMMVTVVVVFTVCWLPFNILLITFDHDESIVEWRGLPYLYFAFHWLAMSHSCYNPVIYCWMNARFRVGFCNVLSHISCLRRWLPENSMQPRYYATASMTGLAMTTGVETTESSVLHRVNTCNTYVSMKRKSNVTLLTSPRCVSLQLPRSHGMGDESLPSTSKGLIDSTGMPEDQM
ncbi:RYamide receptor-like [Anabrus simplex]|uniref:RYamide receptor-like n=1 Tax=Anabrus simplex TaxID=316456 RepID=UPI0034DD3F3C